ncbi:MAG: transposase [Nostoc sp.]|uniref:transposase n=1 Tax=Nostoc sp. TaxID=1180 RepID=UPI002FFB65E0
MVSLIVLFDYAVSRLFLGGLPQTTVERLEADLDLVIAIRPSLVFHLTGDHFLYEYPKLDGECFQQFLDWLSVQLGSDYAILQIDQAPAHTSSKLRWPENIIPLFQPASAPELNPIERLWQLLKKPLKNQLFSSLQALRQRIQEIFDQLSFEQVISVSSYNFILEALFYAASY